MPKVKKRLRIVEAISKRGNPGQEKPILEEFLNMVGMKYESLAVDNRNKQDKLKQDFLEKLLFGGKDDRYRYIHISAHGDGDSLCLGPEKDCEITSADVRTHNYSRCEKPLAESLITVSACGSLLGGFPKALHQRGAIAVVRPLNEINFSESAMFIILFYFMLRQRHVLDEEKKSSDERIAEYVDVFQRTKMSYLNIGGTGTWRLDYWIRQGKKTMHEHLL